MTALSDSVSAYIRVSAALCILTLVTDLIATLLTGLGLRSNDHRTKYKYYRVAVYIMILSCKFWLELISPSALCFIRECKAKDVSPFVFSVVSILVALVVYPVCFAAELNQGMFDQINQINMKSILCPI